MESEENPQNKPERQEILSPKNLLTHQEATIAAINTLEGGGWASEQEKYLDTVTVGLPYVLRALREEKFKKYPDHPVIMYGRGGWHRYAVFPDGNVKFLAGFARYPSEETIQRARDLGFEVM